MRKIIALVFILFITQNILSAAPANNEDEKFNAFKERFMDAFWKINPDWATSLGYHLYDNVLLIPGDAINETQKNFDNAYLDSLKKINYTSLSDNNKIDFKIVENQLQEGLWQINTKKQYQWDASVYNVTSSFAYIINEHYDKLETRLMNVYEKLKNVPAYYQAAEKNLIHPVKILTDLSIDQNTGGLSVFEEDLADSLKISSLTQAQKDDITARATDAVNAIKSFVIFLQALPKDSSARSFRLGKDLYDAQFAFDIQSKYSVDELYNAAVQRKDFVINEMKNKAMELWPKYFGNTAMPSDQFVLIRKVIDTISTHHTSPDSFQTTITKQLPILTAFVHDKNLVYMDPAKPLQVRKEPAYMAGVAGASCSAPGPYEKNVSTYYNVGSLAGWSAAKAESYLREYNDYTLQILSIHEAIPGHYVQLMHANTSPSIIKSVFGNGSMIEGWAVYSELMMMENGYNNSPEMWLMYYKWNLRSVCNTILDIGVHTKNLSKEDAMDLLVRQAFQQQTEAEGKWHRVSVTHVQLTDYFNGFYEITQLRDAYKKKMGAAFNLREFNYKFLSYGSAPVKYISKMMLGE